MAWLPLESNPEVINKLMENLGVPKDWQIVDVYGLDPELLAMVPQPVLAVILLFPVTEKVEKFQEQEEQKAKESSQVVPKSLVFLKQYVSNACGTIALIHSIANNLDQIKLSDGTLKKYLDSIKNLNPEEAGALLQKSDIAKVHDDVAEEGQTKAPDPNISVNYHYVAFVEKEGYLFELDGRKSLPINHSRTSKETLLEDSCKVVRKYMENDPENIQFTVIALTGN